MTPTAGRRRIQYSAPERGLLRVSNPQLARQQWHERPGAIEAQKRYANDQCHDPLICC